MLGERYGVEHDGSQEVLERSTTLVVLADLVVDATTDALDPSSTSKTSNSRFGDAFDVVVDLLTMMSLAPLLAPLSDMLSVWWRCARVRVCV